MHSPLFHQHFRHPQNNEIILPAIVGEARFHRCGDKLTLYLQIDDEGRITRATFQARGCAPVIAVASYGTEQITGLTLAQARKLSILDWDRELGGLPASKRHAYLIFLECLKDPQYQKLKGD